MTEKKSAALIVFLRVMAQAEATYKATVAQARKTYDSTKESK